MAEKASCTYHTTKPICNGYMHVKLTGWLMDGYMQLLKWPKKVITSICTSLALSSPLAIRAIARDQVSLISGPQGAKASVGTKLVDGFMAIYISKMVVY